MKKSFLITTGGSGGHVIPATILYDHLMKVANIIISTDKRGLKYLDESKCELNIIDTPKLQNIFFLPFNFFKILFLTFKSYFLIRKKNIQKIFSTGGYMSLPIIFAAKLRKVDIYLIEPNQVLGRANKFFLKSCKKIFCYSDKMINFPVKFKDKIIIINPLVRKVFYNSNISSRKKDIFSILVVGGSQGATIFDKEIKDKIFNVAKKYPLKVIHQTSEKNIANLKRFYSLNNIQNLIFSFDKDFVKIMQETDLCITRAGASTLAELSILNIPFLAIPLPTSKDNHQFENASFYEVKDCCWILDQKLFENKIEEVLKDILGNNVDYLKKKDNLKKLNYQNTWINVNQKILSVINEN